MPLCLLDDWKTHRHIKGESVCFYLRESTKHGGTQLLMGDMPVELAGKVSEAYREIISSPCSRWGDVRRRLGRGVVAFQA